MDIYVKSIYCLLVKEEIGQILINNMIQFMEIKIMLVECFIGQKFVLFTQRFCWAFTTNCI